MTGPAAGKRLVFGLHLVFFLLAALIPGSALQAQSNRMQSLSYGEIISVEPVVIQTRSSGRGARTGGTVGAVAGAALADRGDGLLGALIGGAIGSAVGRSSDRRKSRVHGKELIVRLDDGREVLIETTDTTEYFPGDRVRLQSGSNGTKVRRIAR